MADDFNKPRKASKGVQKRARSRLAKIRLQDPNALPNIKNYDGTLNSAVAIKRALKEMRDKKKVAGQADKPYDPLAPLTGDREEQELDAATKLQFGEKDRLLKEQEGIRAQAVRNMGSYYDDYKRELEASKIRMNANYAAQASAVEGRVDTQYTQQSGEANTAATAQAADAQARGIQPNLGPTHAQQTADAARTIGQSDATRVRGVGAAANERMELRGATAVQAKGEALGREQAKIDQLGREKIALAEDKGAFRVNQRAQNRAKEREWAAVQKEFGLKEDSLKLEGETKSQAAEAQKVVARIYAAASKAEARAQVRVAELQLEKGKISKSQFRTIKNIYEGLPEKGESPKPKSPNPTSNQGGSGAGGSLATWEKDKVENGVRILNRNKAKATDRATWIKRMTDAGVSPRLARIAWAQYMSSKVPGISNEG